jgi:hypothetical protein
VVSINSAMFRLFNFFLLGIKIKQTTEFAVKKLDNGSKPIITVANTLESALNNMTKTFLTTDENDKYKVGDVIENDYKLYLAYLLSQAFRVKFKKDARSEAKTIFLGDVFYGDNSDLESNPAGQALLEVLMKKQFSDKYKTAIKAMLSIKTGVGIAPLDEIKARIEEAGYSIDEITGRSLCVKFENNDYSKGIISKRDKMDTTKLVNLYNTNEVDALLINQSGAVGISMHARPVGRAKVFYPITKEKVIIDGNEKEIEVGYPLSLKNKDEVKKRCMIITQMELDINKEVQKLGRINRTGQVYSGDYTYIISSIPSETRISAMMERKLRSLSANVSSNQQQASYLFEADDFFTPDAKIPFNKTIDILTFDSRFSDRNLQGYKIADKEQGDKVVQKIKDFSKKLYFDTYDFQQEFYRIFSQEWKKFQQTEDFVGTVAIKDYKAVVVEKFPFYIGDEKAKTSFGRHTFLEKTTVRDFLPKTTESDITTLIAQKLNVTDSKGNVNNYTGLSSYKTAVKKSLDEWYKSEYSVNVESKITSDEEILNEYKKSLTEKKSELNSYGLISEILEVEGNLKDAKQKTRELLDVNTTLMAEGNIAEATENLQKLADAQAVQKKLQEKLDSYGDYSEMEQKARSVKREITQLESNIERYENVINNNKGYLEDRQNTINYIKDFVDKIGYVYKLNHYTEMLNESVDDETGETTEKYSYSQSYSNQSVLYGVSYNLSNMVPSNVTLYFGDLIDNRQVTLSKLKPNLSKKEIEKGKKAEYELESIINNNYVNYWNDNVVKTTDTGINKTKYFLVGGILKTYSLMTALNLQGKITKYTTSENVQKLGIEIADSLKQGSNQSRVYDELDKQYNSSADSVYPIVYKGTTDNVHALIIRYLYNYVMSLKSLAEEEKWADVYQISYKLIDGIGRNIYSRQINDITPNVMIVQMPVKGINAFITVQFRQPMYRLISNVYSLANALQNNNKNESYKQQITDILNQLTDDAFYNDIHFKLNLAENTDIENYIALIQSSNEDSEAVKIMYTKQSIGVVRKLDNTVLKIEAENNKSEPPKIFVNSENYGVLGFTSSKDVNVEIKTAFMFDYEDFMKFIQLLDSINAQPTLITSSIAFNQNSSLFVLESFKDEVVETKIDKYDNTYFDSSIEGSNEDILNSMIEDLYNTIIK